MLLAVLFQGAKSDLDNALQIPTNREDRMFKRVEKGSENSKFKSFDDCVAAFNEVLATPNRQRDVGLQQATDDCMEDQERVDLEALWGEGAGGLIQLKCPELFAMLVEGTDARGFLETSVPPVLPRDVAKRIRQKLKFQECNTFQQVVRTMLAKCITWEQCLNNMISNSFTYQDKVPPLQIDPNWKKFTDALSWTGEMNLNEGRRKWYKEFRTNSIVTERESRLMSSLQRIFKSLMQIYSDDKCEIEPLPRRWALSESTEKLVRALKSTRESEPVNPDLQVQGTASPEVAAVLCLQRNIKDIQQVFRIMSLASQSKRELGGFPIIQEPSADSTETIRLPEVAGMPLRRRIEVEDLGVIGQYLLERRSRLPHLGQTELYQNIVRATKGAAQSSSAEENPVRDDSGIDWPSFFEVILRSLSYERLILPLPEADPPSGIRESKRMKARLAESDAESAQRRFFEECGLRQDAADICERPYQVWVQQDDGTLNRILCGKDFPATPSQSNRGGRPPSQPSPSPPGTGDSSRPGVAGAAQEQDDGGKGRNWPGELNWQICHPKGILNRRNSCYQIACLQASLF